LPIPDPWRENWIVVIGLRLLLTSALACVVCCGPAGVPADFSYPVAGILAGGEPEKTGTLAGRVVAPGTDDGLERVLVERVDGSFQNRLGAVFTDKDGYFRFRVNTSGRCQLRLSLVGFMTLHLEVENTGLKDSDLLIELPMGL